MNDQPIRRMWPHQATECLSPRDQRFVDNMTRNLRLGVPAASVLRIIQARERLRARGF